MSCDLHVLVDEATESISPQNTDVAWWSRATSPIRGLLIKAAVSPVGVVMNCVLAEDTPQVPLSNDEHPVGTFPADSATQRSAIA